MEINITNWLTQIKKGYLDLCILALIESDGRAYGFQIISELEELKLTIKEGTLYPLLSRMTKDGFLTSAWETEGVKGHPRKFYSLTELGRSSLNEMKLEYKNMYKSFEKIKKRGGSNE